jgi:hypothetical protein
VIGLPLHETHAAMVEQPLARAEDCGVRREGQRE